MAVGAAVGGMVGAAAGNGVASAVNPAEEDSYWRSNYHDQPGYVTGYTYDEDYSPAYRLGYDSYSRHPGQRFEDVETSLQHTWEQAKGKSRLSWEHARRATLSAWHRAERAMPGDADGDGR